jgi:hypothetical protein
VGPGLRTALLVGGLVFVALFAAMTLAVALEHGISILVVVAVAVIAMLGLALVGALREPPDR